MDGIDSLQRKINSMDKSVKNVNQALNYILARLTQQNALIMRFLSNEEVRINGETRGPRNTEEK